MDAVLKIVVSALDSGKTVEMLWKKKYGISSGLFVKLKLGGRLCINGEVCRSIDTVAEGDVLTADVSENEASENIVPADIKLDIVYEDEYIIVINKPRKLCVHPSIANYDCTLANGLVKYWQENGEMHKFHAVNRIDKDTSGICVIAKNRFAHGVLSEQMRSMKFKRKYRAILKGCPEEKSGIIDLPIKRVENSVIKREVSPDGKRAVTHYEIIKNRGGYSLAEIFLETGRTHQIRVHFSHLGCPLVGDWLYGDDSADDASGQLLHAYYAEFFHPATGKKMEFSLPLPSDMEKHFK